MIATEMAWLLLVLKDIPPTHSTLLADPVLTIKEIFTQLGSMSHKAKWGQQEKWKIEKVYTNYLSH